MVLKTKSCNLLTVVSRSSPRAAMATVYADTKRQQQDGVARANADRHSIRQGRTRRTGTASRERSASPFRPGGSYK